jgi:flagellar basal body-associated protein FliL
MDNVPVHVNHNASSAKSSGEPVHHKKQRKPRFKSVVIAIAVLIVVAAITLIGLFFYRSTTGSAIDANRYQAVFFTNGQVYFGKLQPLNDSYMRLTGIFYLQSTETTADASTNPQATTTEDTPGVQLIKLGDEIHGPDDEMIISKDQVLFFENLKKDGKVSSSIAQYLTQKAK